MRKLLTILTILASLSGCANLEFDKKLPFVHRIDVQQGNVLDPDEVNQLRPGMSRREVQYVLGSPLIVDTFNQDRWDYLYRMQPGSGELETQRLTLLFDGDRLTEIRGTIRPEDQPAQETTQDSKTVVVPYREREPEGYLSRLWRWITFKKDEEL